MVARRRFRENNRVVARTAMMLYYSERAFKRQKKRFTDFMPKVSILMPTYNQAQYITEALESAVKQTYDDFELLVLDNVSTDNTEEIVRAYLDDKRIIYRKNETNIGGVNNFNKAVEMATGEYIKFLFSDDLLIPTALAEFVKVLDENENVSLVTSFFEYVGRHNSLEKQPVTGKISGYEAIKKTVTSINWIGAPSNVIFRKADFAGFQFEHRWHWMTDFDVWHKLLTRGDLYVIPQFLTKFRQHDSSWSSECMTNYEDFHDKYYYLKHIRDENLYAPLKDDEEFKSALRNNALGWINLIPRFLREKKYNFLKKAVKAAAEEKLVKDSMTEILKKIGRKISKT